MSAAARAALFRGVGRMSELEFSRGSGVFIQTQCGRSLLDFTSGIGVTNIGHAHPRVAEAIAKQAGQMVHGQVNLGYHTPMLELVDALLPRLPTGLDRLFFATTGAEAVENAIKLARHATGKPNVIVFKGGYHGRSFGTMPLTTSKSVYREGFGPFMPGVHVAPYPYALHSDVGEAACAERALADLNLLLRQESTPAETCAVLIEPVLGEGGYVPLPPQFLQSVSTLCRESGMLLIVDEVQSGFGRTGHLFATDGHYGTAPDILVMAKGLASGMPLSAVATRAELADAQAPGSMGGTYAGNAVACAASLATLQVMDDEGLVANAAVQGERMKCLLQEIAASGRYPIRDVRGLGLMIGVEFDADVLPGTATAVSKACLDLDLLLLTTSVFETVRFIPPLCITEKEVTDGVERFEAALQRCFA
eukprot:m.187202 g.187202  ORF g.187202 m.187202 type:complete len:421 (+) comp24788_c0_seq1:83-1345(+)